MGINVLLLHPSSSQNDGGENLPSGKMRVILLLHLAQSKLICTTKGLTVLTLTTVPRTDTSLSALSQSNIAYIISLRT